MLTVVLYVVLRSRLQPWMLTAVKRRFREQLGKWVQNQTSFLSLHLKSALGISGAPSIDFVQASMFSTETLLSQGRIEKRTLFCRRLLDALGGSIRLDQALRSATTRCLQDGGTCVVKYLPPEEKKHVMFELAQGLSCCFHSEYAQYNALQALQPQAFRMTWYCVTAMIGSRNSPQYQTRREKMSARNSSKNRAPTIPATASSAKSMKVTDGPVLRLIVVNESELRRISDGKLRPPKWGHFNARHARRWAEIKEVARLLSLQLSLPIYGSTATQLSSSPTQQDASFASAGGPLTRKRSHCKLLSSACLTELSNPGEDKNSRPMKSSPEELNCILRIQVPSRTCTRSSSATTDDVGRLNASPRPEKETSSSTSTKDDECVSQDKSTSSSSPVSHPLAPKAAPKLLHRQSSKNIPMDPELVPKSWSLPADSFGDAD
jgi:hypothetical protein